MKPNPKPRPSLPSSPKAWPTPPPTPPNLLADARAGGVFTLKQATDIAEPIIAAALPAAKAKDPTKPKMSGLASDKEFLTWLEQQEIYRGLDVLKELGKCQVWCFRADTLRAEQAEAKLAAAEAELSRWETPNDGARNHDMMTRCMFADLMRKAIAQPATKEGTPV